MARHRIYTTSFASVYPHYVAKAEKKGRTKAEVDEIIAWLTGYGPEALAAELEAGTDFETFFAKAPRMNPARSAITGTVLRGAGRDDRGAADAGDTLSRQAGRRAGAGEGDEEDFAGGMIKTTSRRPSNTVKPADKIGRGGARVSMQ